VKPAVPRLHAVTDDSVLELPDYLDRARALAQAGKLALHVRAGQLGGRELIELARATINTTRGTGSLVIVNDRVDVAKAVGAAGVHLPARGLPIAAARQILGPHALIGRSTHGVDEAAVAADEGADYVFLGPLWPTESHPDRPPLDTQMIMRVHRVAVIAIGGVTAERAAACREAGAHGVAAIRSLWHVPEPGSAARHVLLSFRR
jgi:thiamine-phosphate pyrophosphorylase